jgi:DNA-binding XRE family transcriptional regulator
MSFIKQYIKEQSIDPEFQAEYEAEALRWALIGAREAAGLSQRDVAERLGVSQPRIVQVERGSKLMSATIMVRYASEVNARLQVMSASLERH